MDSQVKVVVVGQGYVGLPLAQGMARAGLSVTGLDLNGDTVSLLNSGGSHIDDLSDNDVREMLGLGYRASADPSVLSSADVVVICVPTPLGDAGEPDLRAVEGAARSVAQHLSRGCLVVLESTTYPGTTDELLLPIFESQGHRIDEDFFLAFSPERIDPGNPTYGLTNTPKVVGGVTPASTEKSVAFYSQFVDHVVRTRGSREAETAKLLENTYRHINIALVNEMAKFCKELDIDIWDVINAASTKPFGFQAFYPGPGVGGHCIPIDPNYLSYEVQRKLGHPFRFVQLAQEINNSMPQYIVSRAQDILNEHKLPLNGSRVLLLGVTYKANISDQRESPATDIADRLASRGCVVSYHDPYVSRWRTETLTLNSVGDPVAAASENDLVILLQAHRDYEMALIASSAKTLFDTRGVTVGEDAVRL